MTSAFDLAIGLDATSMNTAAAAIYTQIYPTLFTGKQSVAKDGLNFDVSWDVKSAPTFDLSPPPNPAAIIADHLALPAAQGHFPVELAKVQDALLAELQDQVFQMKMSDVALTVAGGGASATDKVAVDIFVRASSIGGVLALAPLKAVGTTESPSDQWFINAVLLPQAMKLATTLLSCIHLPPLTYPGLMMTAPAIFVDDQRIIAMANIAGKPVPVPQPGAWPQSPFFALMSNDAKIRVAQANTASVIGKGSGKHGNLNIGIGTLYYTAEFKVLSVAFADSTANSLHFTGEIGGSVSAGIKIGCTKFGLNYQLFSSPEPSGTITLSGNGDTGVVARTSRLSTFVLVLNPSGSPIEWILSAATDPLLQTLTAAFSPLITTIFNGISFAAFDIKPFPFDYDQVHLKAQPENVQIGDFQGLMAVTGTVAVVPS